MSVALLLLLALAAGQFACADRVPSAYRGPPPAPSAAAPPVNDAANHSTAAPQPSPPFVLDRVSGNRAPGDRIDAPEHGTNLSSVTLGLLVLLSLACCVCMMSVMAIARQKRGAGVTLVTTQGRIIGGEKLTADAARRRTRAENESKAPATPDPEAKPSASSEPTDTYDVLLAMERGWWKHSSPPPPRRASPPLDSVPSPQFPHKPTEAVGRKQLKHYETPTPPKSAPASPPNPDLEAPASSPVDKDAERKEEHKATAEPQADASPREPQQLNVDTAADVVSQPNLIVHATQ
jgi:hypothetical protein